MSRLGNIAPGFLLATCIICTTALIFGVLHYVPDVVGIEPVECENCDFYCDIQEKLKKNNEELVKTNKRLTEQNEKLDALSKLNQQENSRLKLENKKLTEQGFSKIVP